MKNYLPAMLVIFLFTLSCKDKGPQPPDLIGNYEVSIRLKDNALNKESINNHIKEAIENADDEIRKAKKDIDNEFELKSIDTFTTEGKIEYSAKKFGKSMAEAGLSLGDLGKDLGSALSGLAIDGAEFSESLMKTIKIKIELQADGDVKIKGSFLNMGLSNAKWELHGREFIFSNNGGKDRQIFNISNRNLEGFTLEKDNVYLDFVKIMQ